jgi:hypothetical protein
MGELNFMVNAQMRPAPSATELSKGKALEEGLYAYEKSMQAQKAEEKQKRQESRARMERSINQLQSVDNVERVPEAYRPQIGQFLTAQRNKYYEAAKALSQSEVGSTAYTNAVEQMNKVNQSFKNLDAQLKSFATSKTEAMKDFDKGLVSNGNNAYDVEWLSHMFTDGLPMQISDAGSLYFQRGDGYVSMDDAPHYFLKDGAAAQGIIKLNSQIYSAGVENNPQAEQMVRMQVRQMVENGGRETALSLATDDHIYPGGLGIMDQDLLSNPARADELTNIVVDSYTNMIMQSGIQGKKDRLAKAQNTWRPRSGDGGSGSGSGSSTRISSMSEQDLRSIQFEDENRMFTDALPMVANLQRSMHSAGYGAKIPQLVGTEYSGKKVIQARVGSKDLNQIELVLEPASSPSRATVHLRRPNEVVSFFAKNMTQLTTYGLNTNEGKNALFMLQAWAKKRTAGFEGGYKALP